MKLSDVFHSLDAVTDKLPGTNGGWPALAIMLLACTKAGPASVRLRCTRAPKRESSISFVE
jgi:hypothetical protein